MTARDQNRRRLHRMAQEHFGPMRAIDVRREVRDAVAPLEERIVALEAQIARENNQ